MVVASVDPGTRPVPGRASVMAAAEALLEYANGGRTDRDHESAQRGSAGQLRQSNWATAVGYRFNIYDR